MTAQTTRQRSAVDTANELADRYLDVWNAHDLDALPQCWANDVGLASHPRCRLSDCDRAKRKRPWMAEL
jgi:ketosteroid isomerase-like protein